MKLLSLTMRNRCYVFYHTRNRSGLVGRSSAIKSVNSDSFVGRVKLETTNLFNCLRAFWPIESSQTTKH